MKPKVCETLHLILKLESFVTISLKKRKQKTNNYNNSEYPINQPHISLVWMVIAEITADRLWMDNVWHLVLSFEPASGKRRQSKGFIHIRLILSFDNMIKVQEINRIMRCCQPSERNIHDEDLFYSSQNIERITIGYLETVK